MPVKPPTYRSPFTPPAPSADEVRGTAAERGYDSAWTKLRNAYIRDHPVCSFANDTDLLHRCDVAACIVDHIRPISQHGVRLDPANLRPVCRPCHDALTANLKKRGVNQMPRRPGGAAIWIPMSDLNK
jgi:5-methylcytosine-specific restriction protein A